MDFRGRSVRSSWRRESIASVLSFSCRLLKSVLEHRSTQQISDSITVVCCEDREIMSGDAGVCQAVFCVPTAFLCTRWELCGSRLDLGLPGPAVS